MNRRRFLSLAFASSAAAAINACVPVTTATTRSPRGALNYGAGGTRPLADHERLSAAQARAIFDHWHATKLLPRAGLRARLDATPDILGRWRAAVTDASAVMQASPAQAAAMADPFAGGMRFIEDFGDTKKARAAVRAPRPVEPDVVRGTVTVPPGTIVEMDLKGHCLDPDLPAPGAGEKFLLVPTSVYIDAPLLDIYECLLYAEADGKISSGKMQEIIWAIRTAAETKSPYFNRIGQDGANRMEDACPGSYTRLEQYRMKRVYSPEAQAGRFLNNLFSVTVNGRRMSLLDPGDPSVGIESLLDDLVRRPIAGVIPDDDSDYTLLTPGVAAQAQGIASLTVRIRIANASDAVYVFHPTRFVAETRRPAQRVALPPAKRIKYSMPGFDGTDVTADALLAAARDLRDIFVADLPRFTLDPAGGVTVLPTASTALAAVAVPQSALGKEVLAVNTVGSNLLALHEQVTGKSWAAP